MGAKKKFKKITYINILQIVSVAALLIYMHVAVSSGRVSKIFLATPGSIVAEGVKLISSGELWGHFFLTLGEVMTGYLLSIVVGVLVALIWTLFPKTEEYASIFCSAVMAVPKTAILPLLVLWFGIGFKSKVFLIFLFCVFHILFNTLTGAKQCRTEFLKVARVFEANRVQTVFKVIIPSALPSMFNSFRIAAATALTGVVFSEMQAAKAGLGYLLSEGQLLLNTPRVFFIIILVTLISVALVKIVAGIEYFFCHKWSGR